jgi:hypothetical protein
MHHVYYGSAPLLLLMICIIYIKTKKQNYPRLPLSVTDIPLTSSVLFFWEGLKPMLEVSRVRPVYCFLLFAALCICDCPGLSFLVASLHSWEVLMC